jgi:hypothetical protein
LPMTGNAGCAQVPEARNALAALMMHSFELWGPHQQCHDDGTD